MKVIPAYSQFWFLVGWLGGGICLEVVHVVASWYRERKQREKGA